MAKEKEKHEKESKLKEKKEEMAYKMKEKRIGGHKAGSMSYLGKK